MAGLGIKITFAIHATFETSCAEVSLIFVIAGCIVKIGVCIHNGLSFYGGRDGSRGIRMPGPPGKFDTLTWHRLFGAQTEEFNFSLTFE